MRDCTSHPAPLTGADTTIPVLVVPVEVDHVLVDPVAPKAVADIVIRPIAKIAIYFIKMKVRK